jgi:hypothetical protein
VSSEPGSRLRAACAYGLCAVTVLGTGYVLAGIDLFGSSTLAGVAKAGLLGVMAYLLTFVAWPRWRDHEAHHDAPADPVEGVDPS